MDEKKTVTNTGSDNTKKPAVDAKDEALLAEEAKVKAEVDHTLDSLHEQMSEEEQKVHAEIHKELQIEREAIRKAQAAAQARAEAAESAFSRTSRHAGEELASRAARLNAKAESFDDGLEHDSDEVSKWAGARLNEYRQNAYDSMDSFAREMESDPKKALVDALKMALMIIGALALLRGIFKH